MTTDNDTHIPSWGEHNLHQRIKAKQKIVDGDTQTDELLLRIGMLRQWLNEDRIMEGKRFVTNEDLLHWLRPAIRQHTDKVVEAVIGENEKMTHAYEVTAYRNKLRREQRNRYKKLKETE